jgi:hypothetical protein
MTTIHLSKEKLFVYGQLNTKYYLIKCLSKNCKKKNVCQKEINLIK